MTFGTFRVPPPVNEPVKSYAPGSAEKTSLKKALARMNAATMHGQSKTAHQAEIDSACELIDFWRFNVGFAREL